MFLLYLFIILIFSFIYSSGKIIKNPINRVNNAGVFFNAKKLAPVDASFKTLYFLVNMYEYIIFDITYLRIIFPGKYFKYYSFSFMQLLFYKIIYHIIYFITSYISYVIHIIINKKSYDIWCFIYLYYDNSSDLRSLHYYNDAWNFNSKLDPYIFINRLSRIREADFLLKNSKEELYIKLTSLPFNKLISNNTPYEIFNIQHDNLEKPHNAFIRDKTCYYITDFYSSYNHNPVGYGRNLLVPKITLAKDSTVLEMNSKYSITQGHLHLNYISDVEIINNNIKHYFDPEVMLYVNKLNFSYAELPDSLRGDFITNLEIIRSIKASLIADNINNNKLANLNVDELAYKIYKELIHLF